MTEPIHQTTVTVLAQLMRDVYGHGPGVSIEDASQLIERLEPIGLTVVRTDQLAATLTAADLQPLVSAYRRLCGTTESIAQFMTAAERVARREIARREAGR